MKKEYEKKNKPSKTDEHDKLPSLLNNSRYGNNLYNYISNYIFTLKQFQFI